MLNFMPNLFPICLLLNIFFNIYVSTVWYSVNAAFYLFIINAILIYLLYTKKILVKTQENLQKKDPTIEIGFALLYCVNMLVLLSFVFFKMFAVFYTWALS